MNRTVTSTRSLLLLLLSATLSHAQEVPAGTSPVSSSRPTPSQPAASSLPDIPTLMRQVEQHERDAEAIEKDYFFREDRIFNELDSHGGLKKSEESAFENFWLSGVDVERQIRKDNRDLTPDELKKENERIDKEVLKAKGKREKADSDGKETDSHGHDEITVSRILELGAFSNPRREQINGRPTIVVDYAGDPHARTHNSGEAVIKVLAGTIWIDEQDKVIQHAEGHFVDNFKLGGGLVASVHKDTNFRWTTAKINNEVWLPASIDATGYLRYLLFFSVNGDAHIRFSGYRKFKAISTLLPNFSPAPPDTEPESLPPQTPH